MAKQFVFANKQAGRSILWPCVIPVPVDGGIDNQDLTVRFSLDHAGEDEHKALIEAATKASDFDRYFLEKVVLGFNGVPDETGAPVNDQAMFALMWSEPYIQNGVLGCYLAMREGRLPKNFVRPSASI